MYDLFVVVINTRQQIRQEFAMNAISVKLQYVDIESDCVILLSAFLNKKQDQRASTSKNIEFEIGAVLYVYVL